MYSYGAEVCSYGWFSDQYHSDQSTRIAEKVPPFSTWVAWVLSKRRRGHFPWHVPRAVSFPGSPPSYPTRKLRALRWLCVPVCPSLPSPSSRSLLHHPRPHHSIYSATSSIMPTQKSPNHMVPSLIPRSLRSPTPPIPPTRMRGWEEKNPHISRKIMEILHPVTSLMTFDGWSRLILDSDRSVGVAWNK